ncbi:MAG: hypothetical protein VB957_16385 [Pseudomonadales bacterium]|jgi:hypothetical protein
MSGFILFLLLVIGFVMLLRYLRRREIEAFHDADLSDLEEFKEIKQVAAPEPMSHQYSQMATSLRARRRKTNLPSC